MEVDATSRDLGGCVTLLNLVPKEFAREYDIRIVFLRNLAKKKTTAKNMAAGDVKKNFDFNV